MLRYDATLANYIIQWYRISTDKSVIQLNKELPLTLTCVERKFTAFSKIRHQTLT
jgi:hypothetical protein